MNEIFRDVTENPIFGITLTLLAYNIGIVTYRKFKSPFCIPILVAIVIMIPFLLIFDISNEAYQKGGSIITLILGPATASLAISMYRKISIVKANILPMLVGTFMGSISCIGTIFVLGKLFGLEDAVIYSTLPKSVTVPIALELSTATGGIPPITVVCVVFSGLLGALLAPFLIKLFKIKNPVAIGLALGTSSHGVGTSKAIEIGEVEGAVAGISIGLAGLMTVIIYTLFI